MIYKLLESLLVETITLGWGCQVKSDQRLLQTDSQWQRPHFSMLLYSVLLLCLAVQRGQGQHVDTLVRNLQSKQAYLTALEENPQFLNEFSKALHSVDKLWTVYLPDLLESNSSSVSEACQNSTISIILNSLQPNLTTLPEIVPLLDASGKPGAGLLEGNLYLVPSFDECFKYNYTSFCQGAV